MLMAGFLHELSVDPVVFSDYSPIKKIVNRTIVKKI